jgi:PHD/YefM family antitoxin component YafN of YafNO toxin-antitoxin module
MTTTVLKVGVREFRSHLQQYILKSSPVAITRHGETVGYYIPTKSHTEKSDISSMKQAATKLDKLLAEHGVFEEELFADFRKLKSGNNK